MTPADHILFDLDGTLVDSQKGIINSITSAVVTLGYPMPSPGSLRWVLGPPIRQNLARILGTDDTAKIEAGTKLYREHYSTNGVFEAEVYSGIFPLLEELKSKKRLFVVTAKPEPSARQMMDHLGLTGYFDGIYGSQLDGTFSDKSKLLAHMLEKHRIPSNTAVMIGDRNHDIIAAKKNGVKSVGILYGYGDINELQLAEADMIFTTVPDLHQYLSAAVSAEVETSDA
jgi:phosphoglycolate phosphatase